MYFLFYGTVYAFILVYPARRFMMMQILNMLWVVIVMWLLIELFNGRKSRSRDRFNFIDNSKDGK